MATVLSGTSGALYYKPAGTSGTFTSANVATVSDEITVATYLNFQVNDKVQFTTGGGTLPSPITASTDYYVIAYTASTGVLQVSTTLGGSTITIADTGTDGSSPFGVDFAEHQSVGDCREWSFEVSREELDTTTIGTSLGQYAPFRTFITGFADGSGSATVYYTDDESTIANRLIEDVIQRKQAGANFKLYSDLTLSAGSPDDTASTFIEVPAVITGASYSANPDDAQAIEISFRPTQAPTFDFDRS
jgi:hypothetical protein